VAPGVDEPPAARSLPPMAQPSWIVVAILAAAIAVHLAIAAQLASWVALSLAGVLAAIALAAFLLLHLFGGKRMRH